MRLCDDMAYTTFHLNSSRGGDVKKDECVLGLNPAACPHRVACRYWNRVSELCEYKAVKEQEQKQRHVENFEEYDTALRTVRINKA
ncbi:hypothetical protein ES705_22540 [subsurface metagenome]